MTRLDWFKFATPMLLALVMATPAQAALYLMFNVGDTEDREVSAAGETLAAAQAGNKPAVINSNAERYFVSLPGATMQTFAGSATQVGGEAPPVAASSMAMAGESSMAAEAADAAASPSASGGDSGWVEFEAFAATLMLFSPDGLDQESEVRYEPARVFLREFADGSVYAMITGRNGSPPAAN